MKHSSSTESYWNLEMLVFAEGGKPNKPTPPQAKERTKNSTHICLHHSPRLKSCFSLYVVFCHKHFQP
jgi:hypothetical protein